MEPFLIKYIDYANIKRNMYLITTEGLIYNSTGRVAKCFISNTGYYRVNLMCEDGISRNFSVHVLVAIADALSASRPGARNDTLENYIKRLEQLENIGNDIPGVEKTYAVQAGRELRVIVKPDEIDDITAHKVARDIKEKIEQTMQYPGTIKVTVVRETRAQEEAR